MVKLILLKTGFGYHKEHPLQSFLIIIGIALGISVIVAIDIANDSIGRSFQLSTESLTGKTTHQIIGARAGFDQSIFRKLRVKLGYRNNAPVVEGFIQVKELEMKTLKLMGIDPISELYFRNLLGTNAGAQSPHSLGGLLAVPNRVLMSKHLAAKFGIGQGQFLTLLIGGKPRRVEIFGLLESSNEMTRSALSGVVVTDIATAQEILGTENQINRIDLIIKGGAEGATLADIKSILPSDVTVIEAKKRNAAIRQMSSAFELNLTAMSLLALLVGMFLIYNTITFSVVQRRRLLGILRSLGTTRSEIFLMILSETMIFAIVGSVIGLCLGILLGMGTVQLVSRTVSDLYFVLSVTDFNISQLNIVKALGLGVLACLVSALLPAYEAVKVPPVVAQQRSSLERYASGMLPVLSFAGVILLISGSFILNLKTVRLEVSFGGLFFIVFGTALLVPFLSKCLIVFFLGIPGIGTRLSTKLALRNMSRSLSRTAVAMAALMIAVSVIVGVGIMVGSFRFTVVTWLKNTIVADIYIVGVNRYAPNLEPDVLGTLRNIPGVKTVYPARSFTINSGKYRGATVFTIEQEIIKREWIWKSGTEAEIYHFFKEGSVFVSESFAWKNNIPKQPGSRIVLKTNQGGKSFSVVGIFRDFSSRQGMIVMNTHTYQKFWQDRLISGIGLIIEDGMTTDIVMQRIDHRLSKTHQYFMSSNAEIRTNAINVFDRTFTITIALQILAALVAFIGVFNSIMSIMLERTREVGILRANGMTVKQLWRMIMTESGIIGVISGLLAIPLGTIMAWILVFVINKRSFGWTLDYYIEPYHYLQAIGIAVFASLAAGVYPSYVIGKKEVVDTLRTE